MAIVSVLTFLTFREKVDIIDIQMLCKIIATFPKKNTENMSKKSDGDVGGKDLHKGAFGFFTFYVCHCSPEYSYQPTKSLKQIRWLVFCLHFRINLCQVKK